MLMRLMRIAVAVVTVITTVAFVVVYTKVNIMGDKTVPEISIDSELLEVTVNADDSDLLKGVTAFDEKDGDITDRLIVESISKFTDVGYCKITYAVSDFDNHITTASRQIHYTNYKSPKFTLKSSLVFSVYDTISVVGKIGATDVLDGDISQNVILYSSDDISSDEEGTYSLTATVMNSKGDSSEIKLPIKVEKIARNAPEIVLNDYLIYVKKGKTVDWEKYIKETIDSTGVEDDLDVTVKTDYDKDTPGMYTVDYYTEDSFNLKGHTALIVIVE